MTNESADDRLSLEALAERLTESKDYKILRRIPVLKKEISASLEDPKLAFIVDTETTGLNPYEDEVIEIGFVLVEYVDDTIVSMRDFGNEMREPQKGFPETIQRITGITPELLKGKSIDSGRILSALSKANIVIAHNAAFDRPMCERLFPEFKAKPWACTLKELEWDRHGFESAKLKYILLESGYFFEGHRALDDCAALTKLLTLYSPDGKTYFEALMESARAPSFQFFVNSPYELRAEIRSMGYRWTSLEGLVCPLKSGPP